MRKGFLGIALLLTGLGCGVLQGMFPRTQTLPQATLAALHLQATQMVLNLTMTAMARPQRPIRSPLPPITQPAAPIMPASPSAPTRPSATLAPTATPQPTLPVSSLSGRATGNLYCRTGPAPYYPSVDSLTKGQTAPVLARSAEAGQHPYWLILSPKGKTCWVWGRWFRVEGDTASLPIATAPPPPPAAFSMGLRKITKCGGNYAVVIALTNRGPDPLESVSVRIKDTKTGAVYSLDPAHQDEFWRCTAAKSRLLPGETGEVWVLTYGDDVHGHLLSITVQACTKDGLTGDCQKRTIQQYYP